MEDYYAPKRVKNDPAYTKWLFRMWGKKDGIAYNRYLTPHLCTDKDYAEFNPIEEASAGVLQTIRDDPERGFFCLDWEESNPFEVYGGENQDNH